MKLFVCIEDDGDVVELTLAKSPVELLVKLSEKFFEQFDSKEMFTEWFNSSCEEEGLLNSQVIFTEKEI